MQPKTKYIILGNYKQKVSCDYIIVKPSTSVLSADESSRVADKCNFITSWSEGWLHDYIKQVPIITFAFLSASELKIKTVKILNCVLFFHLLKEQAPTAIKKQSHNNYSYGVLFGLPVYGLNFVKVNTCFEDLFFCVCVCEQ